MSKIKDEQDLRDEMYLFAERIVDHYKWRAENPEVRYLDRQGMIKDLEYILDEIQF